MGVQPPTMTAPLGRRDRKVNDTREALARAALDLFEEQGYAATSIDEIADRAALARRTFFRHFPTKDAVLLPEAAGYITGFAAALADEPVPLTLVSLQRAFAAIALQMCDDDLLHRRERIIRANREHFRSFTLLRIEEARGQLADAVAERCALAAPTRSIVIAIDVAVTAFGHGYMEWFDAQAERSLPDAVAESFSVMLAVAAGNPLHLEPLT